MLLAARPSPDSRVSIKEKLSEFLGVASRKSRNLECQCELRQTGWPRLQCLTGRAYLLEECLKLFLDVSLFFSSSQFCSVSADYLGQSLCCNLFHRVALVTSMTSERTWGIWMAFTDLKTFEIWTNDRAFWYESQEKGRRILIISQKRTLLITLCDEDHKTQESSRRWVTAVSCWFILVHTSFPASLNQFAATCSFLQ